MATKFFLRVGAWYKSETGKALTSDIDITDVVNNTDPNNPFIEDDGSLGGTNVVSITAGTNITLGGTASNPIINASGGGVTPTLDEVLVEGSTLTANRIINLGGNSFAIAEGGNNYLAIDPNSFAATLAATDNINGFVSLSINADEAGGNVKFELSADDGTANAVGIVGDGVASSLDYTANTHTIEGDVIFDDYAGGGVTTASIDNTGKLIRTP